MVPLTRWVCLPSQPHPGLVILPGFACPGRDQACPSITIPGVGAAGRLPPARRGKRRRQVAWIDQQLPDIDWTMSGRDQAGGWQEAGTGLQQRYGREVGHDDRPPAGVASLERLSMTSPPKLKGDSAEREAAQLIAELTGHPARRARRRRADDTGDIDGVPATVVQVANWADVARAVREKPTGAEAPRRNAGATFAWWVRFRGGLWRVVLTPEQWATTTGDVERTEGGLRRDSPCSSVPYATELLRGICSVGLEVRPHPPTRVSSAAPERRWSTFPVCVGRQGDRVVYDIPRATRHGDVSGWRTAHGSSAAGSVVPINNAYGTSTLPRVRATRANAVLHPERQTSTGGRSGPATTTWRTVCSSPSPELEVTL